MIDDVRHTIQCLVVRFDKEFEKCYMEKMRLKVGMYESDLYVVSDEVILSCSLGC